VLIEAMKKSNSILPKDYIDELQDTSYDGVVGHIEFDPNGDMADPMSTVFVVKDGAWVRY
jgi:branched-chain amino acid transport system substrate-binding protein